MKWSGVVSVEMEVEWCKVCGEGSGVVLGRCRGKFSDVGSVEWEVEWCKVGGKVSGVI